MYEGFDRGIDFGPIKARLLTDLCNYHTIYTTKKRVYKAGRALIYTLIELIQLRNGCRITEAINSFKEFTKDGIIGKVTVKICKSEAKKMAWVLNKSTNCKEKRQITTPPRYRHILFPTVWLSRKTSLSETDMHQLLIDLTSNHQEMLAKGNLKQLICIHMKRHHNCNTHSLRYAFINHLLYDQKQPSDVVAKFVGHSNTNQIIRYTQRKNCDKLFDLDI